MWLRRSAGGAAALGFVLAAVWGCASGSGGKGAGSEAEIRRDDADRVQRSAMREEALRLLTDGAVSENPLIRANSIEGLQAAPSRAEPAVRAGLRDENAGVRFVAAMTAGALRLRESGVFVAPLLEDGDPRVRAAAMYALARLGKAVDLSPLALMLENQDPRIRSEAARILGELGNPSAVPMLRTAAAQSTHAENTQSGGGAGGGGGDGGERRGRYQSERLFQVQVAEALAKLGAEGASDTVRAALYPAEREGFESAALAAQILGNLRDSRAVGQLVDLIEQVAAGSVRDADPRKNTFVQPPEVRLAAARSLALMGYSGGMYVAQMYEKDANAALRAQSAFVYGASDRAADLKPLEVMMRESSPLVRVSAAAASLRLLDRIGP